MSDFPNSRNWNPGGVGELGPAPLVCRQPIAETFDHPNEVIHAPIIHIRLKKTSRIWIRQSATLLGMEIMSLRRILAVNVKNRRDDLGWSQTLLASRAGTVQSHISRLERQESGVTIDVVAGCAAAFGCHAWELLIYRDAYGRLLGGPGVTPPARPAPDSHQKRVAHQRRRRKPK